MLMNKIIVLISMIGFIVSFFIILQFFDIIPMTLGQMVSFIAIVGMNDLWEYDLSFPAICSISTFPYESLP